MTRSGLVATPVVKKIFRGAGITVFARTSRCKDLPPYAAAGCSNICGDPAACKSLMLSAKKKIMYEMSRDFSFSARDCVYIHCRLYPVIRNRSCYHGCPGHFTATRRTCNPGPYGSTNEYSPAGCHDCSSGSPVQKCKRLPTHVRAAGP